MSRRANSERQRQAFALGNRASMRAIREGRRRDGGMEITLKDVQDGRRRKNAQSGEVTTRQDP